MTGQRGKIKMGKRRKNKDIPKYANRTGWTQPVYACPACRQCNFYKSYGNLESFREALTNTLMRNLQKTFQYRLAIKYGLIQEHIEPVQFYFEKIGINIDVSDCGLLGWGKN